MLMISYFVFIVRYLDMRMNLKTSEPKGSQVAERKRILLTVAAQIRNKMHTCVRDHA